MEEALRAAAEHQNVIGVIADDSEQPPARYRLIHGGTTEEVGWETLRTQLPEIVREITRKEIEALMTAEQHEAVAAFKSALDPLEKECAAMLASLDSIPAQSQSMWSLMLEIFQKGASATALRSQGWGNIEHTIVEVQTSIACLFDEYRSILHESIVLQRKDSTDGETQCAELIKELWFRLGGARVSARLRLNINLASVRKETKETAEKCM